MKPDAVSGEPQKQEYQMSENTESKRPTHTIYKVLGDGETAKWIKVGVAFPHKDRKGLALKFDGIPVEGRIALRNNRKQDATAGTQRSLKLA
jgi:hypothetical protein